VSVASLIPAVLAFLILGAHFYRAGLAWLVPVCVALAAITFVPRRWAALAAQAALVLGALEWVRALFGFAGARVAHGRPVLRLVMILGSVLVFTLWAAWLLRSGAARLWYARS
jgi:hypothetical protein